ncbi:MAG: hypothetical protein LBP78_04385, partial [Acidaminococcales bacterium]|nr:hypothetical protein [Acidaminococcales bacterium]
QRIFCSSAAPLSLFTIEYSITIIYNFVNGLERKANAVAFLAHPCRASGLSAVCAAQGGKPFRKP